MTITSNIQSKPDPGIGIQCPPDPTVSTDAGPLLAEVVGKLKNLDGLTCLFWAEDLSSRDRVFHWGPDMDLFLCLAMNLADGAGPEVPRHDRVHEPPDIPAKVTATIRDCLASLRRRNDINFALVWGVEDDKYQIEAAGFTYDRVVATIGNFIAGELERYLDLYWTFVRADARRRLGS